MSLLLKAHRDRRCFSPTGICSLKLYWSSQDDQRQPKKVAPEHRYQLDFEGFFGILKCDPGFSKSGREENTLFLDGEAVIQK